MSPCGFLSDYMNQNGVSDVVNPIYQHPGPPCSIFPTISSDDTESEYLNCFKNGTVGPEYLNELPSPVILPVTSNGTVHGTKKFQPQNSINNPDYQQDFTPTFKTHTNGHIPAAENAEYLGPDWGFDGYRQEKRDSFLSINKGHWCLDCESIVMWYHQLSSCAVAHIIRWHFIQLPVSFACSRTCHSEPSLIPKNNYSEHQTSTWLFLDESWTEVHVYMSQLTWELLDQ